MNPRELVAAQALDEGLWFQPTSIAEDYLQQALRKLHQAVEQDKGERDQLAEALRELFAWGLNLKHKKDCPQRPSNFQAHQCKCGRDALQTKVNALAFTK